MQVPIDYPAIIAVLALAGGVNPSARRNPAQGKRYGAGSSFRTHGEWIVAPPGFMKSPVIQAVVRPLVEIQTELAPRDTS